MALGCTCVTHTHMGAFAYQKDDCTTTRHVRADGRVGRTEAAARDVRCTELLVLFARLQREDHQGTVDFERESKIQA